MNKMVTKIDKIYAIEPLFKTIKDTSWSAMCSYAHTGLLQIGRRFTGNKIKPNYKDGEKLEVLQSSNVIILLLSSLFFIATEQIDEVQEAEKLLLDYCQKRSRNQTATKGCCWES